MSYDAFLQRRSELAPATGIPDAVPPLTLYRHQAETFRWATEAGRAAVFLDTGLGKTRIQLTWADIMRQGRRAIILCPLSIASQTVEEATACGIDAAVVRDPHHPSDSPIWVTNYERQHLFDPATFGAVVLDESSILKSHTGATRTALIDRWGTVPYRLACTATPAPNDHTELANHSEFLGAMSRVEMLAAFFVHDDDGWRLKGHSHQAMFRWMAQWAMAARKPSDITGDRDDDIPYELPPLNIHGHIIEVNQAPEGQLFATTIGGVGGRSRARKSTLTGRVDRCAELLDHNRPAIAWCGLNDEAEQLARLVPGGVNLTGTMDPDRKLELIDAFRHGEIRVLVTKPSICGFGLNFQHAADQVFVGLGDSYESYYQAIRRSWRFGQTRPVDVHIVVSDLESEIVDNVRRKERSAADITSQLVAATNQMRESINA